MYILHVSGERKFANGKLYDVIYYINKYPNRDPNYSYKFYLEKIGPIREDQLNEYSIKIAPPYSDYLNDTEAMITDMVDNPIKFYFANGSSILGPNNGTYDPSNYTTYDEMLNDYITTLQYKITDITSLIEKGISILIVPVLDTSNPIYYKIIEYKYNSSELYISSSHFIVKYEVDPIELDEESINIKEYMVPNANKVRLDLFYPVIYYSKDYSYDDINLFMKGVSKEIFKLYDNYNSYTLTSIVGDSHDNEFIFMINKFTYINKLFTEGV